MSGFPVRPTRNAFGPKPINRFEVRDSARELDGPTIGDLMMWTIAGSGVVVPQVWALIQVIAGPDWSLIASAETWDANGGLLPTIARTGVGTGTVTYNATYPDKDGDNQSTDLKASGILEQVLDFDKVARSKVQTNNRIIDVALFDGGVANDWATNDRFLVLAW